VDGPRSFSSKESDKVRWRFSSVRVLMTVGVLALSSTATPMQFCERRNGIVVMRVDRCHRREKQIASPLCDCTTTTSTTLPSQCVSSGGLCNCQNDRGECFPEVAGGADSGRFICTDPTTFDLTHSCRSVVDCPQGRACLDTGGRAACALVCVPCGLQGNLCDTDNDCCSGMGLHCNPSMSNPALHVCG